MLHFDEQSLHRLLDYNQLTDAMELAMQEYASGAGIVPERMHIDFEGNTLLLMTAISEAYTGTKIITLFPENPKEGRPVIHGLVLLNSKKNGETLAIFNGAKLTALRTAAVSAAGIRATTPPNLASLGLIGAGVQGLQQILFAAASRPIKTIRVYDKLADRIEPFLACLQPLLPEAELLPCFDPESLVRHSELIIMATNAGSPVVPEDPDLLEGKHFVAIGSYKPEMREIPDGLLRLARKCVVDTPVAVEESGYLIFPIQDGLVSQDEVHFLGDLLLKQSPIDTSRTTLFKTVGMALFDVKAAAWFYEKALKEGFNQSINL